MKELERIIGTSVSDFASAVGSGWYGKEREAVSLYAFGYLLPRCDPNGLLFDPRQIGIEVRVPKPRTGDYKKPVVTKDLVIWPQPGWTCWDDDLSSTRTPLAVLEWKANRTSPSGYDVAWLQAFTTDHPDCLGFAVTLDLRQRRFLLDVSRVVAGDVTFQWLRIPGESNV